MKAIAGSILILAAAVLFAAGTMADATLIASNRSGNVSGTMNLAGAVVGLIGFFLLVTGLISDGKPE